MENLVQYYIQEAKEGIEVDGEIIKLLNKKEGDTIVKKHGLTIQMFAQLTKSVMDYYDSDIAGKKVTDFIIDLEIKAKFPDSKYVQDITVRSYLCHVLETSKENIDNYYSSDEIIKKEAIKDLALNLAIVQLKKIYKITTLKFAKIFKKEDSSPIKAAEIKETKKELEAQIKLDTNDIIPQEVKDLVINKNEIVKPIDLKNIKNEMQKVDIVIEEAAIKNVNKYLFAISETFNFLKSHFKNLTLKDIEKSEKMLEKAYEEELKLPEANRVFINKINDILHTLGHINSFAMKENYENMNVLAWSYNVINLKAYHTGVSDFDQITKDVEKKVVSVLHRYQPAQRNSYDAYHLVEDFIQICRDQTGEIKIDHTVTDLMLVIILKDYMKKAQEQVNDILKVSTKMNKTKAIEVKKDEQGVVTQIVNPDKTEKTRRAEIEKIISQLSDDVKKARKFFFDLYSGQTTFNDKGWNNLDTKTQNQILKSAKLNRNSAEFLELKLNRNIARVTGENPLDRENRIIADLEAETKKKIEDSMSKITKSFISQFRANKDDIRLKYKGTIDYMSQIIDNYEKTGNVNKDVLAIFDEDDEFKYKLIKFAKIIPRNGNIKPLLSNDATPLLNRYVGMKDENR